MRLIGYFHRGAFVILSVAKDTMAVANGVPVCMP